MSSGTPASNAEWQAWGKKDPLWAVATWDGKKKSDAKPWTNEEFYAVGAQDWASYRGRWDQYGFSRLSCVEIGCGAGRITMQLAKEFGSVHALDVSPEMLAYARQNILSSNVTFHLSSGNTIPLPNNSVDAVFSTHVFQHFDNLEVGRQNFREVQRVLMPGGTFLIHVPIHVWPRGGRIFEAMLSAKKAAGQVKASVHRRFLRFGVFPSIMRYLTYPVEWCFSELPVIGFENLEIVIMTPSASKVPHSLIFGRKSSQPCD
jgi:SAM-dependent methyltransferase